MSKSTAVFFGGVSSENEISIITGTMVCNVLRRGGRSVLPVYIDQSGKMLCGDALADIKNFSRGRTPAADGAAFATGGIYVLSKRGKIKKFVPVGCAFNCCHGGWGEGGGISGLCAAMSVPLASAGIFESALFIDKHLTKLVLGGLGVPVVEYKYLTNIGGAEGITRFPVMVKPARLGSSIGAAKAGNASELAAALAAAFELDDAVLVERYVCNRREINCAACLADGEVLVSQCEEVFGGDVLSYDDKYSGCGRRTFPAELAAPLCSRIRDIVKNVYSSLGMRGIVRFDFLLEGEKVYVSEVNTVPGSLSHYLLSENYGKFYELLAALAATAEEEFARASSKLLVNTGIINNFASNACKMKL